MLVPAEEEDTEDTEVEGIVGIDNKKVEVENRIVDTVEPDKAADRYTGCREVRVEGSCSCTDTEELEELVELV